MLSVIRIHPQNPQHRLIKQVVGILDKGDVIAYPTDSGYALGCILGNKSAMEKIRDIRKLSKHHHFTLMLKDLSHVGEYAKINNSALEDEIRLAILKKATLLKQDSLAKRRKEYKKKYGDKDLTKEKRYID